MQGEELKHLVYDALDLLHELRYSNGWIRIGIILFDLLDLTAEQMREIHQVRTAWGDIEMHRIPPAELLRNAILDTAVVDRFRRFWHERTCTHAIEGDRDAAHEIRFEPGADAIAK